MDSADSLPPLPVFSVFERGKLPELPRNDAPPATGQHPPTSTAPARPAKSLEPVAILHAAGERTRWRILRELSKGRPLAVRNLADALGVNPDLLSKHLVVLRACGAVTEVSGADARQRLQTIPLEFASRVEGKERLLDYGACVLRFPEE